MWHEATRDLVEQGKLVVIGITQEQHAERTRLYAQWKNISWPILHDPINQLPVRVVPVPISIDEHQVVRGLRFRAEFALDSFSPTNLPAADPIPVQPGDKEIMTGSLDSAIQLYRSQLERDDQDAAMHFRMGVALRMHYDQTGEASEFDLAVWNWTRALELDPNHYIFRRRIEQYGARLSKPYPFYDWVPQAISEIQQRGELPVSLSVPLSGAEVARPSRELPNPQGVAVNPDPQAKILRDTHQLVGIHGVVVPSRIAADGAGRVHLSISPSKEVKWNNEGGPTLVWIDQAEPVQTDIALWQSPAVTDPTSAEVRTLEFELRLPQQASGTIELPGYALYHVCKNDDGTCLYLRQDFRITIPVVPGTQSR